MRKETEAVNVAQLKQMVVKADVDRIFSITRPQWESFAKGLVQPEGWRFRLDPSDNGTSVFAHDTVTGMALTIQPYYENAIDPPEVLFIVRHYPLGRGPKFTPQFKRDLEEKTNKDLGSAYSISAAYTKAPPFEEVELIIKRTSR